MASSTPADISKILNDELSGDDKQKVTDYIASLQTQIVDLGGGLPAAAAATAAATNNNKEASPDSGSSNLPEISVYDAASGEEDYDTAADCKQQASDAKSAGDHLKALDLYNRAVLAAPPSALLYSNRAICLMKLGHYPEAEQDCNRALELNPDSGKALKTRGKLRFEHLDDWHGALSDLGQSQSIDFDPEVADMLKELSKKRIEEEKEQAKERLAKEEKMRKKAEEIRKVREEEAKEKEAQQQEQQRSASSGGAGGMPGMGGMGGMGGGMPGMGGMGGGMPGMGGMDMGGLMSMFMGDPEIQQAMQNPKVMAAFGELMNSPGGPAGLLSNPAKLQKIMSDPEVGPILQKIMGKLGAGGGMPFMGGGGGGGGAGGATGNGDEDDIPDMGDLPDLVD